ncbi:ABC transporter permease [Planococcus sp. CAU13]|uniref:ABC transporter permease n=1 Tax=Planococcus sp. CAU13 TaxID=1541197 RepID=UPI001F2D5EE6|nr:FtsX-like permease family protein [Planococcus sp. CAU13]
MTALTLFDLVLRSMRKNIKHYYLYFFALILSVVLYFVFATLQHDSAIIEQSGNRLGSAFLAAGILLLVIAGIFIVYANAIFLKRRSREIGLYQLIGLKKSIVARLLIVENTLLGIGALVIGIAAGLLLSRVFLLLLLKLIDFDTTITVSFSAAAILQTIAVFIVIFALTTVQMIVTVYRNTLLSLFNSDKTAEHPKKPKTWVAAFLAVLGVFLIGFGYWLSSVMFDNNFFINILGVMVSTILGTYLIFRVTLSWALYQIRKRSGGHLGLKNSLSLAPLMHRLKGNANSLTIITVLSAMTLSMIAGAYSYYYSTERETQLQMPFDFIFEEKGAYAAEIISEMDEKGIAYQHGVVEILSMTGRLEEGALAIPSNELLVAIISDEQLQQAGIDVEAPSPGTASLHSTAGLSMFLEEKLLPVNMLLQDEVQTSIEIREFAEGNVINWETFYTQVVVDNAYYEELKEVLVGNGYAEIKQIDGFHILEESDMEAASALYQQPKYIESSLHRDYYSMFKSSVESNGLMIFIAGFLGLVFLISTGSILYFKQMTEAEQEKQSYSTLRQLGFSVNDIMKGIIRKQAFVFGLPLAISLLHSIFALKALSSFFLSSILVPAVITMVLFAVIYLLFALLTVGYYRKTVKMALR